MKEFIGLKSWLESKFIEYVLYKRLHRVDQTISIPSLDDVTPISLVLDRYNELLGQENTVLCIKSESGIRRVGSKNGKNWDEYKQFVIPINSAATHNQAIVLFPNTEPRKAIFVDPMGDEISPQRKRELEDIEFIEILSVTHKIQYDNYHCGDHVITLVDTILNSDRPELLSQEDLNKLVKTLPIDELTLNFNRAQYAYDYILSLEEGQLSNPHQLGVVISNELMEQIKDKLRDFKRVYITSVSEDEISAYDLESRITDRLVFGQYLRAQIPPISQSVNKEQHIKKLSEDILLLESEKQRLVTIKEKNPIEKTDKDELMTDDIQLKRLKSSKEQLQLQKKQVEDDNQVIKRRVQERVNYAINAPVDELSIYIIDKVKNFLELKERLMQVIDGSNDKTYTLQVKELLYVAGAYQQQDEQIKMAEKQLEFHRIQLSKLKEVSKDKLDLVKRWKILDTIVKQAMFNYQDHLLSKEKMQIGIAINKVSSKFSTFTSYGSTFGDGLSVEGLSYQGLAEALYESYHQMKNRENLVISDSRKLLLSKLSIIGIEKKDFKDINTLSMKISRIECEDGNLIKTITSEWELSELNKFSQTYLNDRLRTQYERQQIKDSEDKVLTEKKELLNIQNKLNTQLKQIEALIDDKGFNGVVDQYSSSIISLSDIAEKIKQLDLESAHIISQINEHPNQYLTEKIELLETDLKDKKKQRDTLIEEKFQQEKELTKKIQASGKKILEYTDYLEALKGINISQLALVNQISFGEHIKLITQSIIDQLNQTSSIYLQYENCQRELKNTNSLPGNFYKIFSELMASLDEVPIRMAEAQKEISYLVYWLAVNTSEEVILPFESIPLDFSGMDLRAANLSKIKDLNENEYNYQKVIFDDTVLGSISNDELQALMKSFRKTFRINNSESIKFTLLEGESNYAEVNIEGKSDSQYPLGFIRNVWVNHFPFYPFITEEGCLDEIHNYLQQIEHYFSDKATVATIFSDMSEVNFKLANFEGSISNAVLRNAIMPTNLMGVKFINCNLKNANFNGVIVNENTRLTPTANNLKGIISRARPKAHFSLVGCIDGIKGDSLPRDLRGIDLTGTTIDNIDLNDHIFDETTKLDGVRFKHVVFRDCKMNKVQLENCYFLDCRFVGENSNLNELRFNCCSLENVKFKTDIESSQFNDCVFSNCNLDSNKIAANFVSCKFIGKTEIGVSCDLSSSSFDTIYFDKLCLSDVCNLPSRGDNITIKLLEGDIDVTNSIFADTEKVKFTVLSAEQFIQQLEYKLNDLVSSDQSPNKIRISILQWVVSNINKVDDLQQCYSVLDQLKVWQDAGLGKDSPKWRLFNSYNEGLIYKGSKKISKTGSKILETVRIKIRLLESNNRIRDYQSQLSPEYRFFQKILGQLLTPQELEELNSNSTYTKLIRAILRGEAAFPSHVLRQFVDEAKKIQSTEQLSINDLKLAVNRMKDKDNYQHLTEVVTYLLTNMHPERIDQAIDSLLPTELLQATVALKLFNIDLDTQLSKVSQLFNDLLSEAHLVANTFYLWLQEVVLKTLDQLNSEEIRYFLNLIVESPLSKRAFIDKSKIENYICGKEVELFIRENLSPDERIDMINELLLIFNENYVFYRLDDRKQYSQVKKKLLSNLDSQAVHRAMKDKIINYLTSNCSNVVNETSVKADRLLDQLTINTQKLYVEWPNSLSDFEGKKDFDELKNQLKEWAKESAYNHQMNKFVKQIIETAVKNYYKVISNRKKVNKQIEGIAEILDNNQVKITFLEEGTARKLTLDNLNEIFRKIYTLRGKSRNNNYLELAFLGAVDVYKDDINIFKQIYGRERSLVIVNNFVNDNPIQIASMPLTINLISLSNIVHHEGKECLVEKLTVAFRRLDQIIQQLQAYIGLNDEQMKISKQTKIQIKDIFFGEKEKLKCILNEIKNLFKQLDIIDQDLLESFDKLILDTANKDFINKDMIKEIICLVETSRNKAEFKHSDSNLVQNPELIFTSSKNSGYSSEVDCSLTA
ncbi:hypothetical protein L3V83_08175 [Thiotrichales bacterium 19X7-9]|nr:hypothetical protein [Thiotrichales bacterium 19X7-9]